MEQDRVVPGPAKGEASLLPASVKEAPVGEAEREIGTIVAAAKVRVAVLTGLPWPADLTTRVADGPSQTTGKGVTTMPGFDGTGPEFAGPMTGGAHGWCAGDSQMAVVGDGRGMAFGRGRGYRQGRCQRSRPGMGVGRFGNRPGAWVHSDVVGQTDLQQMERQAASMQQHLNAINQRIESLKTKPAE